MMQREKILIASYYKHLSAMIKIKIIRIKPVLLDPRDRRHRLSKLVSILKNLTLTLTYFLSVIRCHT